MSLQLSLLLIVFFEMLKSEFGLECEEVECFDKNAKKKRKIISFSGKEIDRKMNCWQKLREDNVTRPLARISEDQLGSQTNPFNNIDEAASYVLKIEQERLLTDSFRRALSCEEYFLMDMSSAFRGLLLMYPITR